MNALALEVDEVGTETLPFWPESVGKPPRRSGSVAKRNGSAFEQAVVAYLAEHGFPDCERRVMGGTRDRGDVAGVPGWTLELKAERSLDLAGALTEAQREADHAGTANYCAILKRRSHPIADAYVVVPLSMFAAMIAKEGRP